MDHPPSGKEWGFFAFPAGFAEEIFGESVFADLGRLCVGAVVQAVKQAVRLEST